MRFCFLLRAVGVLLVLLSGWHARAQCLTPNPPTLLFDVLDTNGTPGNPADDFVVNALCPGRTVRFRPDPSRALQDPLLYLYAVLPGLQVQCTSNGFTTNSSIFTYTPTAADIAAGQVTVTELANASTQVPPRTFYKRTIPVYATPAPAFTLAPCPNGQALITLTAPTPYDTYQVLVNNVAAGTVTTGTGQVVTAPAGASITVVGGYQQAPCTGSATQTLAALAPAVPPRLPRLTLQGPLPGGTAQLDLADLSAGYLFELGTTGPGGTFQKVADLTAGSTTYAFPNIPAGCYQVRRTDLCNVIAPAYSNVVCTLSLSVSSAQNRNLLTLADAGPGGGYTVTRTPALPAGAEYVAVPGGLQDTAVTCGVRYTYRVTAAQPGGGVSVSNEASVTTVSNLPPPAPRLIASFNAQNTVDLFARLPGGGRLPLSGTVRYFRQPAVAGSGGFGSTSGRAVRRDSTTFDNLKAAPPCYTARLVDRCGNVSPLSAPTCPALLQATPLDDDGNTISLTWNAFAGPDPAAPVTYQVQRLAADGTVLGTAATATALSTTDLLPPADQQILRYRLRISGGGIPADTASYSNVTQVVRQLRVRIPNAFTPNGDGLNDVLEVKGRFLKKFSFVVVDRNGQEVFRGSETSDTWDGFIGSRAPVNSSYVWRFQQTDETGKIISETGSVTILK